MDDPQLDDELKAHVQTLYELRRKSQRAWALRGVAALLLVGTIYYLGVNYAHLLAAKHDQKEMEEAAFKLTNDPACRALIGNVDGLQKRWTERRGGLQGLLSSSDPKAVEAGRDELRAFIAAYRLERRRLPTILVTDTQIPSLFSQFFKHVLGYLQRMEALASDHLAQLQAPPSAPDAGTAPDAGLAVAPDARVAPDAGVALAPDAGGKPAQRPPAELYEQAWTYVTEDHEKWRVYRQDTIPCGQRNGPAPELPPEDEVLRPVTDPALPVRLSPGP